MTVAPPEHRILIIGAAGMLGHALMRFLAAAPGIDVFGAVRSRSLPAAFPNDLERLVYKQVDATEENELRALIEDVRPATVINCAGLVKQRHDGQDAEPAIISNALLPHRIARICGAANARLIHVSTDCVFSGVYGNYSEESLPDCVDVYGRTKLLGEVTYGNAVTLRTSIIGPELDRRLGLLSWFLAQTGSVKGYAGAIFSGLPTVELARVIRDHVLPNDALRGLYHVSSEPISKYDLLFLMREIYGTQTDIVRDHTVHIDRSLDSSRFRQITGYIPASWPELVRSMKAFG